MKLTAEQRKKQLRALRRLIETDPDPIVTRIAYSMEFAVRYATENTVGWPTLVKEARENAELLRDELARRA